MNRQGYPNGGIQNPMQMQQLQQVQQAQLAQMEQMRMQQMQQLQQAQQAQINQGQQVYEWGMDAQYLQQQANAMHRGMKVPKKSKPNLERFLQELLNPNVRLSFYRFKERPTAYRHACMHFGVGVLPSTMVNYYDGSPIEIAGCNLCGRVFYYTDE